MCDNGQIMKSTDFHSKRVLVRVDLNVPTEDGIVLDDTRIKHTLRTVNFLRTGGAKIILISHMGRTGTYASQLSLRQVMTICEHIYNQKIIFIDDCLSPNAKNIIDAAAPGSIIMLENLRFHIEETKCDVEFAKKLADLGDFYINEAFSVSHRNHASMVEIPKLLPHAFGFSFLDEVSSIDKFLNMDVHPKMSIIGGSKLSTKVKLIKNMVTKVDKIALGGGIAGAFLSYFGNTTFKIFNSDAYDNEIKDIMIQAQTCNCKLIFPVDFSALICNNEDLSHAIISSDSGNASIFDIGPMSVKLFEKEISSSRMVLWNGPVGLFERSPFDFGTKELALHIAKLSREGKITSVIGGGDTGNAMKKFGVDKDMVYLSTAGGAFLMYIEGTELPAIHAMTTYSPLYNLQQ